MSWVKRITPIRAGDIVVYSKSWLRSTGQLTGAASVARGRVKALIPFGPQVLADIDWNTPNLAQRVNIKNLSHADDEQARDDDS